jgi:hypothetical protein
MPAPIDELIRRRVIQQWLSGLPRDKIAADNNIGSGTVTSIVNNYKIGLGDLDFDKVRELAVAARKQGLNLSELASHVRLYNYFIKSGASENAIESFIANVSSTDIPTENVVEYVNQLYDISKSESIPVREVPNYIEKKIEEKKKIDDEIKDADTMLQSKNMGIQAINEHIQLSEKLNEHNLSFQDIDKLLNLMINAKEYGFDAKKIVGKLRNIKRIEKKEKGLENNCRILTKQVQEYNEILPLAQNIVAMNIGISE